MAKNKLSPDDILKADDLKRETIEIPEWGGEVEVRELTAAEKYEVAMLMVGADGKPNYTSAGHVPVLAATYGLGLGKDNVEAVGAKSGDVIERIAEKVLELSGMQSDAVEAAADFLPELQNGGSPSA